MGIWRSAYVQYLKFLRKILVVDPLSCLGSILSLRSVDARNRYLKVLRTIVAPHHGSTLDVGAGGVSPLTLYNFNFDILSLDVQAKPSVDVIGSAYNLPFKERSFTNVICVDTIEHIPKTMRDMVLKELIRVSKKKVVIHTPLEDGEKFLGRRYDIALNEWYSQIYGIPEPSTLQHIINIEPSPRDFMKYGFRIEGTHNATLWLRYMRLLFLPLPRFVKPRPLAIFIRNVAAWIFYLVNKCEDKGPPFWGGICIFNKGHYYVTKIEMDLANGIPKENFDKPPSYVVFDGYPSPSHA